MVKSNNKIYLDYAAGVLPNPSSIHEQGVKAKTELRNAHKKVANILGARPEEIIFTSGGTESNNIAIQGIILAFWEGNFKKILPHIITTNIEHPSVLETFKILQKRKLAEISIIPVENTGIIDPKKIKKEIKKNTILISVMYANNEIGTIQPIREIVREIRHHKKTCQKTFLHGLAGVGLEFTQKTDSKGSRGLFKNLPAFPLLHTDAVQAVNYLDLNVEKLGVDLLSLSGSKIEGAGKIGILYKKKSVPLLPIFGGGDQENGLRPGTENLVEILKFSSAFEFVQKIKNKEIKRLKILQNYFIKKLKNFDFVLNGDLENRLPNNINITFPKISSELLVIELSTKGIMVSSKSACKSSNKEGSYVIQAINNKLDSEIGGLRFSMGRGTTKANIDYTIRSLSKILQKLEKWK